MTFFSDAYFCRVKHPCNSWLLYAFNPLFLFSLQVSCVVITQNFILNAQLRVQEHFSYPEIVTVSYLANVKNMFDNHCFDTFLLIRPSWILWLIRSKEANREKKNKNPTTTKKSTQTPKKQTLIKVKVIISYIFLLLT